MTLAQIAAIISLLVAFNVPQNTITNVQGILLNAQPVQTITVVSTAVPIASTTPTTKPVCRATSCMTGPGYFNEIDGCFYAGAKGQTRGGLKTYCPPK